MSEIDELKLKLEGAELDRDAALFRENMWHEEYDKRCELFQHLMEKYRLIVIQVRNLTDEKQNILTAYDCWYEDESEKSEPSRYRILDIIKELQDLTQ